MTGQSNILLHMAIHILLRAKIMATFCLLMLANKLNAQTIEVVGIKGEYSLRESVCVTIKSHADSATLFSIALERSQGDGWTEVISDVFNYADAESKIARVFKIARNGKSTKCFYPGRFFKIADEYKYRLHVHSFKFHRGGDNSFYSNSFRFSNE